MVRASHCWPRGLAVCFARVWGVLSMAPRALACSSLVSATEGYAQFLRPVVCVRLCCFVVAVF